jgi:hypothetical protein
VKAVFRLLGACVGSVLLYAAIFGFALHKPLTLGVVADLVALKRDYAATIQGPKLVIFAGSNARFSHRCETIAHLLSMPCANFGIGRGIGFDYLVAALKPVLHAGDVVFMPWEYDWYLDDKAQVMSGPDAPEMFYGNKRELVSLGLERTLRASFSFTLPFVISAMAEMGLDAIGFQRRAGLQTLTAQGDETGHTPDKAQAYVSYVTTAAADIPSAAALSRPSYIKAMMADFFAWARQHGVTVVGGLQTVPDDLPVNPDRIKALRRFYEGSGESFLVLDNHSQYPRSCFYDTLAHLNEPCQIRHSTKLAAAIAPFFAKDRPVRHLETVTARP